MKQSVPTAFHNLSAVSVELEPRKPDFPRPIVEAKPKTIAAIRLAGLGSYAYRTHLMDDFRHQAVEAFSSDGRDHQFFSVRNWRRPGYGQQIRFVVYS